MSTFGIVTKSGATMAPVLAAQLRGILAEISAIADTFAAARRLAAAIEAGAPVAHADLEALGMNPGSFAAV
jgi:hypothetical protein